MTAADLRLFLLGEQSEAARIEECEAHIQTYEPTEEGKSTNQFSLDGMYYRQCTHVLYASVLEENIEYFMQQRVHICTEHTLQNKVIT